jgi:hypothetical protein
MKKVLSGIILLGIVAAPAFALPNDGSGRTLKFEDNVFSDDLGGGARILYAPSEGDDPGYRAGIAAAAGGTCDYYDARAGVPSLGFLTDNYDCVIVWANFAFFDNVAYGNVLADFVDAGGSVVLGSFCTYTSGNFLSGRIMTAAYCPVVSPTGSNHFSDSSYVGDGTTCLHDGVVAYNCVFRDILTLQGGGALDGTYADREIAGAYRADFKVIYSNGSGSSQLGGGGDWDLLGANGCACDGGSTPVEEASWGQLKGQF